MATLIPWRGRSPTIHPSAFVAPTAVLIGDVTVGEHSSIWFGAVLRGDDPDHGIVVGPRTSVQDNCVVHVGRWGPTVIGADVTVGHGAKFESCTIGDRTVVGMNAVILQNATVGQECVVGAGAVVRERATRLGAADAIGKLANALRQRCVCSLPCPGAISVPGKRKP